MNFNNPKVRQAIMEHILFAIGAVQAAIPDVKSDLETGDGKMMTDMTNALRNPIIMQILQFTLNLDYRLKNSLVYNKENTLDDEPKRDSEGE